jgi:outer membrane protein
MKQVRFTAFAPFLGCALAALSGAAIAQPAPRDVIRVKEPEGSNAESRRAGPAFPSDTPEAQTSADAASPLSTFAEALQRAYWTNPDLLAARARLRSADFRLPQARSAYGPRLNYQVGYGWDRDNIEQPFFGGFQARSGWSAAASAILTQPLYTFGRNLAAERTAKAQIDFERASLRFTESRVLFDTVSAYVGALRDREGVRIAQENLDLLNRELTDTRTRFRFREVTSTDLQQVETRHEFGKAQLLVAKAQAATADAQFLRIVGAPAGELTDPNPLNIPARDLETAYALAQTQSPIIVAAYARERASRAQGDAARADLLPRVDLRGSASLGTQSSGTNAIRQTQVRGEVVLSGPIFETGLRRARVGEAEAANDADWRLIDSALRESKAEIAGAWNEWQMQQAALDRLKAAIAAAEAAYRGAVLQERAGLRTTLDVLDLARDLLSARTSFNSASANAYLAQARLMQAMGSLEHNYLFPEQSRYDPDTHFDDVKYDGSIYVLTPIMRALDGALANKENQALPRDPAAQLGSEGVDPPKE